MILWPRRKKRPVELLTARAWRARVLGAVVVLAPCPDCGAQSGDRCVDYDGDFCEFCPPRVARARRALGVRQ